MSKTGSKNFAASRTDGHSVTRNGGFGAEESGDGRFLYYTTRGRATGLWRIPVGGGDEGGVLESVASHINFTVAPEGVYYIPLPEPGANPEVRFLRLATGENTLVKALDKSVYSGLSLSPDARSLLYVQVDREGSDLMLVENFQ